MAARLRVAPRARGRVRDSRCAHAGLVHVACTAVRNAQRR
eukprot:CAMPEP_0185554334 /NCGR_PEP_ID=MMETSP1381-20130426/40915_1 /TAXON_ID=298111 /ORGANISM="Pavlova sp., Strain CCMP459" /LENGTH=39 /DNA_ID= /DNA_START= /DNA_END= /DNA_ORIENTATION=